MEINKFKEKEKTIEYYCRRHNFSRIENMCVKCLLSDEIKKEYDIPLEEDCIYRNKNNCMMLERRTRD